MSWREVMTPQAQRHLHGVDSSLRRRVFAALDRYVLERHGDVRKLRQRDNEWRLRVGDWRIRFRPDSEARVVVVLSVRHRREAYRDQRDGRMAMHPSNGLRCGGDSNGAD